MVLGVHGEKIAEVNLDLRTFLLSAAKTLISDLISIASSLLQGHQNFSQNIGKQKFEISISKSIYFYLSLMV